MLQTERLAFDTSLYQGLPPEKARKRMTADTGAYLMEADISQPPERRMTYLQYLPTKDGRDLICSADGEKTLERFHNHEVSKQIFSRFLETDQRLVGLWISPPDFEKNQPEGRINVYIGHEGGNGIDYFAIPVRQDEWGENEYIQTAQKLSKKNFNNLDELRKTPLYLEIADSDDPVELLARHIGISDNVWRAIAAGRAKEEQARVSRKARGVIDRHFDRLISSNVSFGQRIRLAARFERELMQATGRTIDGFGSGCGASNNELLVNNFKIDLGPGKEAGFHKESIGTYVKECPYCHHQVNGYMKPGDHCPNPDCHQVFLGVC